MSVWNTYPPTYREKEVQAILSAAQAGECVSVVGLSGAGKSNLMGFIAHRQDIFSHPAVLVDCNRLLEHTPRAFFGLLSQVLGDTEETTGDLQTLDRIISKRLSEPTEPLCILLDRFDALSDGADRAISSSLRALRDAHKYQLTFVIATRTPLDQHSELAELFYAHTLWLGPLSESDARWNVRRYAQRKSLDWGDDVADKMIEITWGYPALLRAASEAYAMGAKLEIQSVGEHPAVQRRVAEFWVDEPSEGALRESGLAGQPLLRFGRAPEDFDTSQLTAKEHLLLEYLKSHPGEVCEKDALIQAVWPEDEIYERGIRDDSLAQLVRRLRVKIEPDPSSPRYIHTVSGRGYRFTQ